MQYSLYVCLQDENKIAAFTMDTDTGGETGALTPSATYAVGRRPMAVLATRLDD